MIKKKNKMYKEIYNLIKLRKRINKKQKQKQNNNNKLHSLFSILKKKIRRNKKSKNKDIILLTNKKIKYIKKIYQKIKKKESKIG